MVASSKGVAWAYHGGDPQVCCMTVEGGGMRDCGLGMKFSAGVCIRLLEVCGEQGSNKRGIATLVQPYVNAKGEVTSMERGTPSVVMGGSFSPWDSRSTLQVPGNANSSDRS